MSQTEDSPVPIEASHNQGWLGAPPRQITDADIREHHAKRCMIERLYNLVFPDKEADPGASDCPEFILLQRPVQTGPVASDHPENEDLLKNRAMIRLPIHQFENLEALINYSKGVATLLLKDRQNYLGAIPVSTTPKSTDEQIDFAVSGNITTFVEEYEWLTMKNPPPEIEVPDNMDVIAPKIATAPPELRGFYVATRAAGHPLWTHVGFYQTNTGEYAETSLGLLPNESSFGQWANATLAVGLDFDQFSAAYRTLPGQEQTEFKLISSGCFALEIQKVEEKLAALVLNAEVQSQ